MNAVKSLMACTLVALAQGALPPRTFAQGTVAQGAAPQRRSPQRSPQQGAAERTSTQGSATALTLESLRAAIDSEYPGTEWVSARRLREWMARPAGTRPLLLDIRSAEEFAVSHLRGARRIDPDANPILLSEPPERTIVVYCSVGYRSAAIMSRLRAAGFTRIYNLEGGLFGWANEGGAIYRGATRVQRVHPYDAEWGRLLNDDHRAPLR